jgi:D-alanyl-D-alanine carboxypeptidase
MMKIIRTHTNLMQIRKVIFYFLILIAGLELVYGCKISSVREGELKIQERFKDTFHSSKYSKSANLLVHSDRNKIHIKSNLEFPTDRKNSISIVEDRPFHVASIGKLFTSVLIFQLIENKQLSLDSPIDKILGKEILKDLFVFNGIDHSTKVTVKHLLAHTSGIEDYFESKEKNTKAVLQDITIHPDTFWTPEDLLNFTRQNQKAVGAPGDTFHYSDTGYILLGLALEKIYKKSFERIISDKIFQPLSMKNSYMHLRSSPMQKSKLPLSTMMLGDINVTDFKSISCDWAGGGIISTTEDLLIFQKALVQGKLIPIPTLESMRGTNEFMDGILYGYGMMTIDFGKMSVLIPSTPYLYGHSGILGTLLFYSPDYDTHIIINLGSTEDVGATFELMFWIMNSIKDIDDLNKEN